MKTVLCLIARANSSRLPEKVLRIVDGISVIEHIILNLKKNKCENSSIVLCTTNLEEDDVLANIAKRSNILIVRGSVLSVASRMIEAASLTGADTVVRITADNIFTDIAYLDELLVLHKKHESEYSRIGNLPAGVTAEVINVNSLIKCYEENDPNTSEYMTLHIFNPKKYKCLIVQAEFRLGKANLNLSIDTLVDFERTIEIFKHVANPFNLLEVINYIESVKLISAYIDEKQTVKLIDKRIEYLEFKKYLMELESISINIEQADGWYENKLQEYEY